MHFRLSSTTVAKVFNNAHQVMNIINQDNKIISYRRTGIEKEILITIWYISNIESLRYENDHVCLYFDAFK